MANTNTRGDSLIKPPSKLTWVCVCVKGKVFAIRWGDRKNNITCSGFAIPSGGLDVRVKCKGVSPHHQPFETGMAPKIRRRSSCIPMMTPRRAQCLDYHCQVRLLLNLGETQKCSHFIKIPSHVVKAKPASPDCGWITSPSAAVGWIVLLLEWQRQVSSLSLAQCPGEVKALPPALALLPKVFLPS